MLILCGIDEAGRGALAGPVCAAAVVLGDARIDGLADSKTLTERARHRLAEEIRLRALAWGVGWSLVEDIDRFNILRATLLAMRRAYEAAVTMLAIAAEGVAIDEALIDGDTAPDLPVPSRTIVRGDATVPAISAASILAKVARDAQMRRLAIKYPLYGFDRHKGYGTREHLLALSRHGPSPEHRRSFRPVARAC